MSILQVTASPEISKTRKKARRPRILMVTPEFNGSRSLAREGGSVPRAKAGGLADMTTMLVDELADYGLDVQVALPEFRRIFQQTEAPLSRNVHLCSDPEFFEKRRIYENSGEDNRRAAIAFQREVIRKVIPQVKPDIVHCHDWMTGLIPAAARSMGVKSLFTIHNLHDEQTSLGRMEDGGLNASVFWQNLHYSSMPSSYEDARREKTVNWMASGIHAADHVNTVSHRFLDEMMDGRHPGGPGMSDCLRAKYRAGAASGILNAPGACYEPSQDKALIENYDESSHVTGKRANKLHLQKMLGLEEDVEAPLILWPSRLDPGQKGCQLLADILYNLIRDYWALGLQVVFVADGPSSEHFQNIAQFHGLSQRIAVRPFSENLSRLANAASDFVLMPSAYEPCGLSQMIALKYGSLPVVHNTGGLSDTVHHLNVARHQGNGFVFDHHTPQGLRWGIDEAIRFFIRPRHEKDLQISRILKASNRTFSAANTARQYVEIYEQL